MDKALRILLVEDSATQALQFSHFLEQSGIKVACVPSAEQALERLNLSLPDLVITDYHLPGISGNELCRKIRMNVNARGIPVLMLTSETAGDAERHGLESGADDYVSKSEDWQILLARVQALLRRSRSTRALTGGVDALFARARLLVVEDSATYRQFLVGELGREGYEIGTATTGQEALNFLATRSVDGVILDLGLPDMDGEEVCRSLVQTARTGTQSMIILVVTARETKEAVAKALEAGADDIVGKSRDISIIKARLRSLLRRKFVHEEDQRIDEEFRCKELEIMRARAEKESAEARAALAGELEQSNRKLESAYRELKEAQSQLVQSAKMASLGQLVAGIAHEINNPLAFVMNHLITVENALRNLAKETAVQVSADGARTMNKAFERIGDMHVGLQRIKDLVLKLRTFSRLDEGEHKYVMIEECIESVLTLLQYRLKDRIDVTRKYGDVKMVSCYPGPLNQVLMNLIANAIDAIEGKGEIMITTGKDDSMFFIAVGDNGKGMSEAVRERIFEPFFTTKPVGQGTGLGLSISYAIVLRHEGKLEVRSEPGKGTEFVIKIPLEPEMKARQERSAQN